MSICTGTFTATDSFAKLRLGIKRKMGGTAVTGRKIVLLVVVLTIIALILGWFFLQGIIENFDVERASSSIELNIDKEWELAK